MEITFLRAGIIPRKEVPVPVIGFICPRTREEVSFDHFDTCTHGPRGRAAYSPWLARFAATKILKDTRHAGLGLTATRCLGCPRATYIETQFRYHQNPRDRELMDRGSALHELQARYLDPEIWGTEATDPMRATVEGELFGVRLTMQMDAWRRDWSEIIDGKYPLDWSVARREKQGGKAKLEHVIQLNIGRLLLAQQKDAGAEGYDPGSVMLTVWDHGMGKNAGAEPLEADHMEEYDMGAARPWNGAATVVEIVEIHTEMQRAHEAGEGSTEEIAAGLPLTGETMMGGAKCEKYCGVAGICTGLVRKFGRPK